MDQQALNKLKEECPNVITACVDLRNWDETKKTVLGFGVIDILINNAGIVGSMPGFEDIDQTELLK